MIEAMHTAVAGMNVSALRLGVAAGNIANARTSGPVEPYGGYVPQRVEQTTTLAGSPRATVQNISNPAFPAYLPDDPDADASGTVGMPNVNLPGQFVDLSIAQRSYEANIAVLRTMDDMMKILIDREA